MGRPPPVPAVPGTDAIGPGSINSENNWEAYLTYISQIFLIFGGILPYIPQYMDIASSGDASGFSTLVCFVLILANTLRIVYWFGHYFDEALLLQSVVMLIAMFVMLELCIRMERLRAEARGITDFEVSFLDLQWSSFWQWTDLASFVEATVLIACIAFGTLFIFKENPAVVEGIGYFSLLTESCLALPQFLKNLSNRSVRGMNVMMVLLWTVGDAFKGFFYVWKNQPLPFILNACIQIIVDFAIFIEIAVF